MRACFLAIVFAFLCAPIANAALAPDQIALIVNRNEPEGARLAAYYARVRNVPDDRIITLDLPTVEEIPAEVYDREAAKVRAFLREHALRDKVRCLVTFYGVPLRFSNRVNAPRDTNESAQLRQELNRVKATIVQIAVDAERQAAEADPSFKAESGDTLAALVKRLEAAGHSLDVSMSRATDAEKRKALAEQIKSLRGRLAEPMSADPTDPPAPTTLPTKDFSELMEQTQDAAARTEARAIARTSAGLFGYMRLLESQQLIFMTLDTAAAFDSELSLLWWTGYDRSHWLPNALNPHFSAQISGVPPNLMVMRLDADQPATVRKMIDDSIAVEQEGLTGKLVVDARGMASTDSAGKIAPMGVFDARLRALAKLVQTKSKMPVVLDDLPDVLKPDSVDGVALYCGWYSVRHYVPGMKFNRGAVGFHIASFELITLRQPAEPGWVRGLENAGVVGTLGPVAEPYLHSFPAPDEFFPLLMTGKLTLAEVYWATTPLTSWMQAGIGDPLYTPFAKNPALAPEEVPLPARLALSR